MSILVVLMAVAAVAQGAQIHRDFNEQDIASQAAVGNWDAVHRLLGDFYRERFNLLPVQAQLLPMGDIESLKPLGPGHQVYGESESSFMQHSNINGQTSTKSGGHRVVNNNGVVVSEDFTPNYNDGRIHRDYSEKDIASQAAVGNWDAVHRLLGDLYRERFNLLPVQAQLLPMGDIESLKPLGPGHQVYGESESSFMQHSNINGQTSTKSGGHRVVNNNGVVISEDFTPIYNGMGGK